MNEEDFAFLAALVKRYCGLALGADKQALVERRLTPVASRHGFATVAALMRALAEGNDALTGSVAESLTTGDSSFFRDPELFVTFRDALLPPLMAARETRKSLRIWCAGSSNGQEPYSLAMMLDTMPALSGWTVEILATDLSAAAIARAREARYSHAEIMRGLPLDMLSRYVHRDGDAWRIVASIREKVCFERRNLLESFAALGRFDAVFCRNVLIYFDARMKRDVLRRLNDCLAPDGVFVLGAAESVLGLNEQLEPFGSSGLHLKTQDPRRFRATGVG